MKREYEIGLIINPETAEEDAEKIKTSITDILEKGNGTIENIDDWGRKVLSYPIEKHSEGIYIFIKTISPGDVIAAVERRLKLNEKVMRFIIIRLDDKLKKTNKLEKKWKRSEKFSKKPASDSEREHSSERSAPVDRAGSSSSEAELTPEKPAVNKSITEEKITEKVEKEEVKEQKEVEIAPEVKKEKNVEKAPEVKEEKAADPVEKEKVEKKTAKKTVKKVKEEATTEIEAVEEKPAKPKKEPAKKTPKKAEEKDVEEVENAETK